MYSTFVLISKKIYINTNYTIKEDYCTICFHLYSSEVVSLGSFVSKRLNLYFWTVKKIYINLSSILSVKNS